MVEIFNKKIRSRLVTVTLVCLFCLGAYTTQARVFWRRSSLNPVIMADRLGWRVLYSADLLVNGGRGRLNVLEANDLTPRVAARLQSWFKHSKAGVNFSGGAGMMTGVAKGRGCLQRFLLLSLEKSGTTLVFVLEQDEGEYKKSLSAPEISMVGDLPEYPGGLPELLVENRETRTILRVSRVESTVDAVGGFYRQALEDRGYRSLLPAVTGGFLAYGRGGAIYCVLARDAAPASGCAVALLYKQLRGE